MKEWTWSDMEKMGAMFNSVTMLVIKIMMMMIRPLKIATCNANELAKYLQEIKTFIFKTWTLCF